MERNQFFYLKKNERKYCFAEFTQSRRQKMNDQNKKKSENSNKGEKHSNKF